MEAVQREAPLATQIKTLHFQIEPAPDKSSLPSTKSSQGGTAAEVRHSGEEWRGDGAATERTHLDGLPTSRGPLGC
jgi:hypothetical protein